MKTEVRTINPKQASEMLKGNTRNRNVSTPHVNRLAAAMRAGEWKVNGDAIRFNGVQLIDGQHRLHAIIKSGVTIKTLVITDLPPDVFDSIDIGKQRSGGNTLEAAGEKYPKLIAAALRKLKWILKGRADEIDAITNVEVMRGLAEHPEIRRAAARIMCSKVVKSLIPPGALVALHYLFCKKDETLAELFIASLDEGSGLVVHDPIYWLRQRLVQNKCNAAKLQTGHMMALTIKAWNAMRGGEKVRTLKWNSGEKFPVIR